MVNYGESPFGPAASVLRRTQAKAASVRQALSASDPGLLSQARAGLDAAAAAPVPHFYTLEASVDGDALRDGGVADPDALRWCVVDVNGMSDHDDIGFWQAAAEVPLV